MKTNKVMRDAMLEAIQMDMNRAAPRDKVILNIGVVKLAEDVESLLKVVREYREHMVDIMLGKPYSPDIIHMLVKDTEHYK